MVATYTIVFMVPPTPHALFVSLAYCQVWNRRPGVPDETSARSFLLGTVALPQKLGTDHGWEAIESVCLARELLESAFGAVKSRRIEPFHLLTSSSNMGMGQN